MQLNTFRTFAEVAVQQPTQAQMESLESKNLRIGVDTKFD